MYLRCMYVYTYMIGENFESNKQLRSEYERTSDWSNDVTVPIYHNAIQ